MRVTLGLLMMLLAVPGCNRSSAPPTPLPVEQLPSALEKAFSQAQPESKDLAKQVVASVQAQDYAKAFLELQQLAAMPNLTKEQRTVTARGLLTVNGLLQTAQTKGDEKAAEVLKFQHMTK